jgi:hypothetical protein
MEDKFINKLTTFDLIISDYNIGEVHIYKINKGTDIESFAESHGHNTGDCYYIVGHFINIIDHRNEKDNIM